MGDSGGSPEDQMLTGTQTEKIAHEISDGDKDSIGN
jgi:hypothetical protein